MTTHSPMPELCKHDDPSWCDESCAEKARAFDEWVRKQLGPKGLARLLSEAGFPEDIDPDENHKQR